MRKYKGGNINKVYPRGYKKTASFASYERKAIEISKNKPFCEYKNICIESQLHVWILLFHLEGEREK